ncbi:MAG: S9 family peptidase [Rhodothermales bacterium]
MPAIAQSTDAAELTLESLFASPTFYGKGFQGGRWAESGPVVRYIERSDESGATDLMEYDLEADTRIRLIDGSQLKKPDADGLLQIEDYAYSADRSRVLLYTDSERVWRLNTKGYYYVYDVEAGTLAPVADRAAGLQMFAKFSPDGERVAFVRDRDLFVVDLATGEETRLTDSGSPGGVINGTFDWVYEEEFGLRDGFRWSPDGQHIAFFQLDESATRDFQMTDFRTLYPEYTKFRYPKAGEVNAEIRVGVIDLPSGETRFFDTDTWNEGGDETEYLALMDWAPAIDGQHYVWMARMNRDQNDLDLLYGDPATMDLDVVLEEKSDSWIDVETGFSDLDMGTLTFLDDDTHFVWRSDRSGYSHLYLYENDGTLVRPLTSGEWDVTSFHGIDEAAGALYVTGTRESPIERHLYRVSFGADAGTNGYGAEPVKITDRAGWHAANTSADLRYYIDTYSNVSTPPVVSLHRIDGELVKVLEANEALIATVEALGLAPVEFMEVPAADGTPLNAYLIKPRAFDASKAYPLLVHTYGGPGSQEVRNAWGGTERLWHYMLAEEHGVLVAGVDNRGTGGRGKGFKAQTYKNLGILEAEDQIAAGQWFGAQPWVDADRLGIWGWSYGGYLSLLAMLYEDGPETYDLGVAVAPVTNWRFYDTIYTERYLSTPQKNPDGYDLGSPVTYAANLRADQDLLLVHGDFDDNVHVQNTVAMTDALQAQGKQFDMMIYPGRNHGIYGGSTRLHLYTLLTDFITENL